MCSTALFSLVSVIPNSMLTLRQEIKALSTKYCCKLRTAPSPLKLMVELENSPPMTNRWTVLEEERMLAIFREVVSTVSFRSASFRAINQAVVEPSR